jgi:hypothetical protein
MKKTLFTCMAIAALLAIASTAGAITCTVDQRPGATLLVPYFQVSVDGSGNVVGTGATALDTIVTIANASSAPMIAHVSVFNQYSELALDFNIALTGFDVQAMRMADVISGTLPVTVNASGDDTCQKNAAANVYPDPDGFLRVRPLFPVFGSDNTQATTAYPVPAFGPGLGVIDLLSIDCDGNRGPNAVGYVTIDHANYCNLSNPSSSAYYNRDAIGMENNLWGEIIFTSGTGIPTYAMSTVNIEADDEFGTVAQSTATPVRTFYARYWNPGDNSGDTSPAVCPNCGGCTGIPPSINPADENFLNCRAPWDVGYGDQREPLGLTWAARWFDEGTTVTTNFRVWRGSRVAQGQGDFCDLGLVEPTVTLSFFDEDEKTTTSGSCVSPCNNPTFNFPLETQQRNISDFNGAHPAAVAGWVQMVFLNPTDGDVFDQAWVDYSFEGAIALETILIPGTQLDPSTCNPLGLEFPATATIVPEVPTIPTGTGQ